MKKFLDLLKKKDDQFEDNSNSVAKITDGKFRQIVVLDGGNVVSPNK